MLFADAGDDIKGTAGLGVAIALAAWRIYEMWIASRSKRKKEDLESTKEEIALKREASKADIEETDQIVERWKQYANWVMTNSQKEAVGLQQSIADLQKKFDTKIKDEQDCRVRVAHLEARVALLEGHSFDGIPPPTKKPEQ